MDEFLCNKINNLEKDVFPYCLSEFIFISKFPSPILNRKFLAAAVMQTLKKKIGSLFSWSSKLYAICCFCFVEDVVHSLDIFS